MRLERTASLLGAGARLASRRATAGAAGHAAVFGVTGGGTLSCAVAGGRRGYELRADLDFDTNGGGGPDAGGRLGGRQRMKSVTSSSSTSSKTAIVKITGVSRTTLYSFMTTRRLRPSR